MKITTHTRSLAFFLFLGQVLAAQTVNIGEMVVKPNTIMSTVAPFDNKDTGTFMNDGEVFLYSHFNNDGLVGFTPGFTGYTRFQGTVPQKIEGSVPSEFYDVIFNNPSAQPAFQLFGEVRVNGNSDFFQGIVKDDDFGGLFTFENNATHTNTDNDSHVDGYVQKNGNVAFQYPIGDGGFYRFARIMPSDPNVISDKFTGKYFLQNSNPLYPHQSRVGNLITIDDKEYWTVDRTAGQTEIMLTLSWDQTTTPSFIWGDLDPTNLDSETITIARWDDQQNLWVDEGGIVEIGANGIGTGTVTSFLTTSGFGVFTLAKVKERVEPAGNLVIYNAVTPDGDGMNDYFIIDGIRNYPNNKVTIFNRWGVKVFETTSYDSSGNVFKGYSHGRTTITPNEKLPTGTYYYVLTYEYTNAGTSKNIEKAGFLYINDN